MTTTKKFNQPKSDDPTPIGNLVHWYILEQGLKKTDIAQNLGINPTTLSNYFKQKSLHTVIVWRIAKAINYNLFAFLAQRINIPYTTPAEMELHEKITTLTQENEKLKTENQLLKDLLKR